MTVRRRDLLLVIALLAAIGLGLWAAVHVWQNQQREAIARAAVPKLPNLQRWPPELRIEIERTGTAVRAARSPTAALGHLAELYGINGFTSEATQALTGLRRIDPKNPHWPYLLADLHLRTADKAAAATELEATLALDPSYVPAWLRLGEAQAGLGRIEAARKSFARVTALAPGDLRGDYALVALDAQHGGAPAQIDQRLTELLRTHANIRQLHELRADARAALGDNGGAAHERRLAEDSELYLDTSDPWLDELLAHCYDSTRLIVRAAELGREGRYAEDEALLQRAVTLAPYSPANPFLWEFLSNLYLKLNRPADARATLETAVADFPDEPRMVELLAQCLRTLHASDEAAHQAHKALVRWPQHGPLHAILGYALRDTGQMDDAIDQLREALRLDPTLTEARYNLGCALIDRGRRDEAHDVLAKTLELRPDYAEALFAYGALVLEAGDMAAAEPPIKHLNELRPEDANARYLLASLHRLRGRNAEQTGDPATAAGEYEAGLAVVPDYPALLREAGTLALRREQPGDAATYFARYVKLSPDDPRGYVALGIALQQSGHGAEATAALETGLVAARKAGDQETIGEINKALGR